MKTWKKIWFPKELQLLQVHVVQDQVSYTLQTVSKGTLKSSPTTFTSLEALQASLKKTTPIVVHVSGSGVLTRLTEYIPGYKEQLIVNGDKDDFYFNSFHDGGNILVTFFRKKIIEELVHQLTKNKFFLLSITGGIIPILTVASENELIALDYTIQLSGGKILRVERNEEAIQRTLLSGVFYDKEALLAKALYHTIQTSHDSFEQGLLNEQRAKQQEEYAQYRKFVFFGLVMAFTILFALFGNYLYLNSLNQQIADLEVELTLNNDNLSLLEKLKQERIRKELLVDNAGVYQKHFLTFYLDKIGGTIPAQIDLQELYLFPLKEALKEKRKVVFEKQTMHLVGTTPSSELLEEWMNKLNRFSWIKSVQLVNYLKSEGNASFKLLITLQE
jgi:hypothetical protein